MAKIKIPFNGTDYSINESALASAKDSLKTHLETVMNGSGGGLEPITWDGVIGDKPFVEIEPGTGIGYVKVSDTTPSLNDLAEATFTIASGESFNPNGDTSIFDGDDRLIVMKGEALMIFTDPIFATEIGFPGTGTYLFYAAEMSTYVTSIIFAGSTDGSTTITLDGVPYSVDPTKLSNATDGFIAHIGTLVGEGGGLEPITWDGVIGDRPMLEYEPGVGRVKVSDTVPSLNDLAWATFNLSNGESFSPNGDTSEFKDYGGAIIMNGDAVWFVSDANMAAQQGLPGTGTYMFYAPEMTGYVASITFAGGSTGGDTKLTINGTEYLVDSTKLSDAIADLHEALGRLSE